MLRHAVASFPGLFFRETVNKSLRGEQSRPLSLPLRHARCLLSLRERIKVRGNRASDPLAYRTIPGTVELPDSCGGVCAWRSIVAQSWTLPHVGARGRLGPLRRHAAYNSGIRQIENLRYDSVHVVR